MIHGVSDGVLHAAHRPGKAPVIDHAAVYAEYEYPDSDQDQAGFPVLILILDGKHQDHQYHQGDRASRIGKYAHTLNGISLEISHDGDIGYGDQLMLSVDIISAVKRITVLYQIIIKRLRIDGERIVCRTIEHAVVLINHIQITDTGQILKLILKGLIHTVETVYILAKLCAVSDILYQIHDLYSDHLHGSIADILLIKLRTDHAPQKRDGYREHYHEKTVYDPGCFHCASSPSL